MKAKELRQYLDKFLASPAAQQARVQIALPNREKLEEIKRIKELQKDRIEAQKEITAE